MLRYIRIAIEFAAGFLGVLVVLGLLVIWRLNARPITSEFLTPYLESNISHFIPDARMQIAHSLITWNNIDHSIALHADGVVIKDHEDIVIAEIPDMNIRLSVLGILFGHVLPTELSVDHPQIRLIRKPSGEFDFGGVSPESDQHDDIKTTLQHIADNLAHAHITHKLEINRAVFEVHDEASSTDWSVSIPEIELERREGVLSGHASVDLTQEDKISTIAVDYTYNSEEDLHQLTTRFTGITPSFFAGGHPATLGLGAASIFDLPLTGEIEASLDSELNIDSGSLQIHGDPGNLNYPSFWDSSRSIKSLDIKANYDHKANKLTIAPATIDFGGPTLDLTITGDASASPAHDMDFVMNVQMADWPMNSYAQLWPKPFVADPRDWMIANMTNGNYDRGEATFKGSLSWSDIGNLVITEGSGKISASHATIRYIDSLPPVEDVSADASFDLTQMTVQINSGGIGNLKLSPFAIHMTELDKDTQYIDIPLKLSGPIPDILKLIDYPPLGYAKAVGLSPGDISGNADGLVDLKFPLLRTLDVKDVTFTAEANLTDVASSKLVKGIDASEGSLSFALNKDGFSVKGPAVLNKVPFQIEWKQNFAPEAGQPLEEATVTGTVKDEQWTTLGLDMLAGTRGPTSVTLQMTQTDKKMTKLMGSLDFTAAEIHVDQLNWKKPSGTPALLKFVADMPEGKPVNVKNIDMQGPKIVIKGTAVMTEDAHVVSMNLSSLLVGRTNASLRFTQSSDVKGTVSFNAEGDSLDISGLQGGKEPDQADPRPKEYRVNVKKLYTSKDGFIANAEGYAIRDGQGWSAIALHGLADGAHQLDIDLRPENGGRVFSLSCDDFGKALKGLGLTDTVKDGDLKINGSSTPDSPRVIEGTIKVGHFNVSGLPALVVLLNATSPFGITGILSNSVDFDHMNGKFRWQGDGLELTHLNASGSAVGMTINGKIDMNSGRANLNGNIVPFSMVNRVLGSIPVLGDIVTGGNGGGVLAVAYTIKGSLSDPSVNVNPMSLLTPGFLRNLFFGSDEDTEVAPAEANPAPTPLATPEQPRTETNINK